MNPYNETVRSYFAAPSHVGSLPTDAPSGYIADVRDAASQAHLQLAMVVSDGRIDSLRFRASGCPHLLAAAEWVCRQYENGPVHSMHSFAQNDLMHILSVPVEKTGRILLLQDALVSLCEQYTKDN